MLTKHNAYANIKTWLRTKQTQQLTKNYQHSKNFIFHSSTIALGTKQKIQSNYDLAKNKTLVSLHLSTPEKIHFVSGVDFCSPQYTPLIH